MLVYFIHSSFYDCYYIHLFMFIHSCISFFNFVIDFGFLIILWFIFVIDVFNVKFFFFEFSTYCLIICLFICIL